MDKENSRGKTIGVILGAGKGTRMPTNRLPKQFMLLEGKPVILYSIETFDSCPSLDEMLVVVPAGMTTRMKSMLKGRDFRMPVSVMVGGEKRQDSCFRALRRLSKRGDVQLVVIHDAARPLVSREVVENAILQAKKYGAAAVATRSTDTVLEVRSGFISSIPRRDALYNAQTPQIFAFDLVWQAHKAARRQRVRDATDDVQLVLRLGKKVRLVEAPPENMKVTTRRDLDLASLIIKERLRPGG